MGPTLLLEEIARRAGVGSATLHRHFRAHRALLEAVFDDRVEQMCAEAERLQSNGRPARRYGSGCVTSHNTVPLRKPWLPCCATPTVRHTDDLADRVISLTVNDRTHQRNHRQRRLPTTPGVLGVPGGAPRSHALAQTQSTHRIWAGGGDTELHVWLGGMHGFEGVIPTSDLTTAAFTHPKDGFAGTTRRATEAPTL